MDKNALVVKSNALIQTSYRLTTNEQRIILACVAQVRRDEPITDQHMYSISVSEFSEMCGIGHNSAYRDLRAAAISLKRKEVRITQEPNGKGRREETLVAGWVQSIKYSKGSGLVSLRFNHDILPYLSELNKSFTSYKLASVVKMSSSYGARIYEVLLQWLSVGEREVSVAWLREVLQLEDKYKTMCNFKSRVLSPAIRDINEHSDIWLEITQRKTGRKVTHIKFKFGLKEARPPKKIKLTEAYLSKRGKLGESRESVIERLRAEAKV